MTRIAQTYPQFAVQLANSGWTSTELAPVRVAFDLALSLFTAGERGSGKPLIDHHIGTASGVLVAGGSFEAVAAALLHAAYDLGDFGDGRTDARAAHRRRVSGVVGAGIEDLVFRYHCLGWSPSVAANAVAGVHNASQLDRAVLLIRVANEVDDALDGGLVLSGNAVFANHSVQVHEAVVVLAEQLATPAFSSMARQELLTAASVFPTELIVGARASRVRLPASASLRPRVLVARMPMRATRFGRRLARRLVRALWPIRRRSGS